MTKIVDEELVKTPVSRRGFTFLAKTQVSLQGFNLNFVYALRGTQLMICRRNWRW